VFVPPKLAPVPWGTWSADPVVRAGVQDGQQAVISRGGGNRKLFGKLLENIILYNQVKHKDENHNLSLFLPLPDPLTQMLNSFHQLRTKFLNKVISKNFRITKILKFLHALCTIKDDIAKPD